MHARASTTRPNPRENANILSVLLWTWTYKIFRDGYSKILGPDNLFDPLTSDRSDYLGNKLEKQWLDELERCKKSAKQPSLLKAIVKCFKWEYLLLGLLHSLNEFVLRLGTPILLGKLLKCLRENGNVIDTEVLVYAGGMCLAAAFNAITIHQTLFSAIHLGGRIRIAVCSVIYRKAMRLSSTSLRETSPGKIVNLVSNDVSRFGNASVFIHHMWSAPLTTLIITYFLYSEANCTGVSGILLVFIVVPIQTFMGKLASKYRLQSSMRTDERIRLMDEIISGVKVIKMYSWEQLFSNMISLARKLELKAVRKAFWIRGIVMTFIIFITRMAIYITLVGMLFLNQHLTAEKVFVFSSYYNILAFTMFTMFVQGTTEIPECIVGVRRIQKFLMCDEFRATNEVNGLEENLTDSDTPDEAAVPLVKPFLYPSLHTLSSNDHMNQEQSPPPDKCNLQNSEKQPAEDANCAVEISNATAKWDPNQAEIALQNVNVKLEKGKLYGVIGAVGSGKSSLLSAILGELSLTEGRVNINGTFSYASQDSWVFGSTVRQNILFGQPYNKKRYQKVVTVCALASDFRELPQGDMTLVSDRGSSLSGGQKARINLARCIYREADIYILDDPLSAVDTHVGNHLFEKCIQRFLHGKTRILATHQLQFIKYVDSILLVDSGTVTIFNDENVDYMNQLLERPEFSCLLALNPPETTASDERGLRRQISSIATLRQELDAAGGELNDLSDEDDDNQFVNHLEKTSGSGVKGSILLKYFTIGNNWCYVLAMVMLFILTQFFVSANDFFLLKLVEKEEEFSSKHLSNETSPTNNSTSESFVKNNFNLIYIYTGLISSILLVGIVRSILFYFICVRSNQNLHDKSFKGLIKTEMRFFDTNPSGRILNRFSKDVGAIDDLLPRALIDAGQIILMMVGSFVLVCIVNPIFSLPLLFIAFLFFWVRKVYLATSKNLTRLEGVMSSPIFTHLNATLKGLATIRAFNAQNILKLEFDRVQDAYSSSWYMSAATSVAFGYSLDVFCFIFTTIVTFTLLIIHRGVSEAEIGLAISSILSLIGRIQWGLQQSAEVSNQMTSVERILEYTLLPPEEKVHRLLPPKRKTSPRSTPFHPTEKWPIAGHIYFKNVYMRYSVDSEPVLKNLNLTIKAREKVGIVGRTGTGKSSLISALFRFAKIDGTIEFDGIDTGAIYLEDLRKNISIIPQNPFLFAGSLRQNLDPFGEFDDKSLWDALEVVELKESVGSNGLDSKVFDHGSNFSVGQRQLVCLARAILRNNKILILDEATANVDPHTDSLIQKTIKSKFASCTVLTIAHRLNTVMDSDKILVMDKGEIVEFGHPYTLLQNYRSVFRSLVQETGHSMSERLEHVAEESFLKDLNGKDVWL